MSCMSSSSISTMAKEAVPEAFVCPILCTLMIDPVVATDGHTYERRAIEIWFAKNTTSPLTGQVLGAKSLIPNHALRNLIDEYCQGNARRQMERQTCEESLKSVSAPAMRSAAVVALPSSSALKSWQKFEKPSPAATTTVIVCASRRTLNSGEGTLVGFEQTRDGTAFESAFHLDIKLAGKSSYDESLSCMAKLGDSEFCAGTRDGSVNTWKLERNAGKLSCRRTWSSKEFGSTWLHQQEVTSVAAINSFALLDNEEDCQTLLASGSRDYTVKLWSRANEGGNGAFKNHAEVNHRSEVFCVAGTRQGHLISGGADWSLKAWDYNVPDAAAVQVLDAHSRSVKACCISPDSPQVLASGSEDETVCIWDLRLEGSLVCRIDTGSAVRCLHWRDGFLCAGGGVTLDSSTGSMAECMGGWLRFFDPRRSFERISDATIYRTSASASGGAGVLRSDGDDKRLRTAHTLSTHCISGLVMPNGLPAVVTGGDDKKLRVWSSVASLMGNGAENCTPFAPRPHLAFELGSEKSIPISVDALQVFQI